MLVIDRFEDKWAIIENNGQTFEVPKSVLAPTAKEGDVIEIKINHKATKKLKDNLNQLTNNTFK